MTDNKKLPDDEKWKEQLSFISGNILAWGLVVLNLWPILSHFQTGTDFHFTYQNIKSLEFNLFSYSVAYMSLASCIIVLAIAHISTRGIWLILPEASIYTDKLDRLCKTMYDTAIIFLICMSFYIFISFVVFVVYSEIVKLLVFLSIPFPTSIAVLLILIVLFLILFLLPEILDNLTDYFWISHRSATILSIVVFFVVWSIFMEACYTMDLTVNGKIFNPTRGDIIEVYVDLGGAASDANVTKLTLLDSNGTLINNLTMYFIGQGQYASYIQSSTLLSGRYKVVLEYPDRLFSSSYPFVGYESQKSQGFVVIS